MAQRQRKERERELHRERMRRYRARQRLREKLLGVEYDWRRVWDARLRNNKLEFHVEWEPENNRTPPEYTWEKASFLKLPVILWLRDNDPALLDKVLALKAIQEAR